ncbi:Transcriptional regulator of form adherence 6 [Colletotrichum trifolii]|uniref:Transcriptional regulator of form adherence 6 n=1 Tax=Colletotrichum trifolii TaxID=5466 RepID=A0A4R8RP00_COLTR|nr:Transcriptional regulator of form adherence 6 [Colletotrichum trifolii]
MPRPTLPPTPASSTDIKGQDGSKNLASLQMSFELPPPAIVAQDPSRVSPTDTRTTSFQPISPSKGASATATTAYPVQPSETVKSRRRSSAAQKAAQKENFALPPPPTRSRKIIQMKPRGTQEEPEETTTTAAAAAAAKASGTKGAAAAAAFSAAGGPASGGAASKKKQPSATSAAGRKIARKTAHSLIERRRRSKMNEEFAVLKNMIPACTGEMHKLAILQASIEYVRYLEDCVSKLKAQRDASAEALSPTDSGLQTPSGWGPIPQFVPKYHAVEDDVEMTDSEAAVSPTFPAQQQQQQHNQHYHYQQQDHHQQSSVTPSPALSAQDARHRQDSYSSVSTSTTQRHYSYSAGSATTSPAFGPQAYGGFGHGHGVVGPGPGSLSALTSPALAPQRDLDQEATAALLMLNSDRRGTAGGSGGGGSASASSSARGAGRGSRPSSSRQMIPYYTPSRYRKPSSEDDTDTAAHMAPPSNKKASAVHQQKGTPIFQKTFPPGQTEEELLAEFRRSQQQQQQPPPVVDDSTSSVGASSSSSDGRRRRRRNRNKQVAKPSGSGSGSNLSGTLGPPPVAPRIADSKPVRLQLGLNLDVDLELKARLQGDVCLTLLCPYWRGNIVSVNADGRPPFQGHLKMVVSQVFQPASWNVMEVAVMRPSGPPIRAVLKMFDRRFSPRVRHRTPEQGSDEWSPEFEEEFVDFVRRGVAEEWVEYRQNEAFDPNEKRNRLEEEADRHLECEAAAKNHLARYRDTRDAKGPNPKVYAIVSIPLHDDSSHGMLSATGILMEYVPEHS